MSLSEKAGSGAVVLSLSFHANFVSVLLGFVSFIAYLRFAEPVMAYSLRLSECGSVGPMRYLPGQWSKRMVSLRTRKTICLGQQTIVEQLGGNNKFVRTLVRNKDCEKRRQCGAGNCCLRRMADNRVVGLASCRKY